jgi:L-alanine-DL-glutamate epimerase-like enolase superfamily enzyme
MMSVPNFYRLEARRVKMDFYNAFLEEPLEVRGDQLVVPKQPGLGGRLNLEYLQANEVR